MHILKMYARYQTNHQESTVYDLSYYTIHRKLVFISLLHLSRNPFRKPSKKTNIIYKDIHCIIVHWFSYLISKHLVKFHCHVTRTRIDIRF